MSYLSELLENLKKPVPVQWRVQTTNKEKTKATCSAFIDARQASDILDKYCTYGWETQVKEIAGFIFYGVGIRMEDGSTMWRWDTGARVETDAEDAMFENAGKSAASDAFKRACVHWQVGKFIYDMPMITLPCNQYRKVVDQKTGETIWDLTKYINDNNLSKPKSANKPAPKQAAAVAAPATPSAERPLNPITGDTPPPPPPADGPKPKLDAKRYDAMVKAIAAGQKDEVRAAMDKYDLTLQQRTLLTTLLK